MASGWTNEGKEQLLAWGWQNVAPPTNVHLALADDEQSPTADHNTIGTSPALVQIATGNGYTAGGIELTHGTGDFTTLTQDNTNDWAQVYVEDTGADPTWTASGGTIPSNSPTTVARWAVLMGDYSDFSSEALYAWFDLGSGRTVSDGQSLILQNCTLRIA